MDYYFKINSIIIPDIHHLKNALDKFYKEKIFNLDKDTTIVIQFKILIDVRTIRSNYKTVKVYEFNELFFNFKEFWNVKGIESNYEYPNFDSIIFTYIILSLLKFKLNKSTFYRSPKEHVEKRTHKINGFNLPNTMDFSTWEIMKYQMIIAKVHKSKSKAKYYIKIKDKSLNVDLKLNGQILSQFTDMILS